MSAPFNLFQGGKLDTHRVKEYLRSIVQRIATLEAATATVDVVSNVAQDRILGRTTAGSGDSEELTKAQTLSFLNVEDGADVTDSTNVNSAGAVMNSDTSVAAMSFAIDEDDMSSNSATKFPVQQSVKAYVDANGGGDCVRVANGTVSGASSLDLELDTATYKHFRFVFDDCVPAADGQQLWLRVSDDGGSTFEAGASDYAWCYNGWEMTNPGAAFGFGDQADSEIALTGAQGNAANEFQAGTIEIINPGNNAEDTAFTWSIINEGTGGQMYQRNGGGRTLVTNDTTDIRILYQSGNIATMNYELYGFK